MACWHTEIKVLSNGKIYVASGDRSKSYFGKFWVAKLLGTDPKFGFNRQFVNDKDGAILEEGCIYQVYRTCQWAKRPEEYFVSVSISKSDYQILTKQEVISLL